MQTFGYLDFCSPNLKIVCRIVQQSITTVQLWVRFYIALLAEMGWRAPIKLEEEIGDAYRWYPAQFPNTIRG